MSRFVLVLLATLAFSQMAEADVFLENLTWTELRAQIISGKSIIIVPIGGTEQSGPHIALGKHNARVRVLAEKIAAQLGNALVAPVIAYVPEGEIDPPTEHMKFPGTISLKDQTFIQLLEQAGRSLHHAGFTTIVLIGDHGGYQGDLSLAAKTLNKEWGGKGRAFACRRYYELTQNEYVAALKKAGADPAAIGSHAALADTSLQLAVAPEMVRKEKLRETASGAPSDGVYGGWPADATAELGQKGVDLIVAGTVSAIRNFAGNK